MTDQDTTTKPKKGIPEDLKIERNLIMNIPEHPKDCECCTKPHLISSIPDSYKMPVAATKPPVSRTYMTKDLDKEYVCDENGLGLLEEALDLLEKVRDKPVLDRETKYAIHRSAHNLMWFLGNEIREIEE